MFFIYSALRCEGLFYLLWFIKMHYFSDVFFQTKLKSKGYDKIGIFGFHPVSLSSHPKIQYRLIVVSLGKNNKINTDFSPSYTTSATVKVLPPTNTKSPCLALFLASLRAFLTVGYALPFKPYSEAVLSKTGSSMPLGMLGLQK